MGIESELLDMIYRTHKKRTKSNFVSQGETKSQYIKFFKSQYLTEFFRKGPTFLHVIIVFIGSKITFSNLGSQKDRACYPTGEPVMH